MSRVLAVLCLVACTGSTEPGPPDPGSAPTPPSDADATAAAPSPPERALALAISRFTLEDGGVKTQPARLLFLGPDGRELATLDDPASNVFHKAIPWRGGLLTLGGAQARVVHWTRQGDGAGWDSAVLWQAAFGGTHDRMRDAELGDVDGDGQDEIVVATHDQGVVAVLDEVDGAWTATELSRTPDTFVHEIEVGDLDGDGTPEIYATPSQPNKSSGASQPGSIARFAHGPDGFTRTLVASFQDTHAKEILVTDLGAGPALYAVAEGVTGPGNALTRPVRILRLDPPSEGAEWTPVEAAALLGERQSRFLLSGDLDGDGTRELIATGMRTGLWRLDPKEDGTFTARQIDGSTGGFEHAAHLADLDGDGAPELYVASEPERGPRELRRYVWKDGRMRREILHTLEGDGIVWGIADVAWP